MSPIAEEVGSAYVSVWPNLKGFSRMMERELRRAFRGGIEVPVKPVLDPKKLLVDVDPDGRAFRNQLSEMVGRAASGVHANVAVEPGDRREYQARLKALLLSVREKQTVEVDFDRDVIRRSAVTAAGNFNEAGVQAGKAFSSGFQGILSNPVLGPAAIIAGVVGTAVALPLLGSAVSSLTIAGGALASVFVGAFALRGDKDLQAAVKGLVGGIDRGLTSAASPLKGPFLEAISTFGQALRDIAPDVKDFFSTIADSHGVQDLAAGLGGFIKSFSETGALKSLADAIGPMLSQIGMALPDIGNALSQFINSITRNGAAENATHFFGDLLRTLATVIRWTGAAMGVLTRAFDPTIAFLKTIWGILTPVWTFVGYIIKGFLILGGVLQAQAWALVAFAQAVMDLPGDIVKFFDWLWKKITGGASTAVNGIVSFVKGIPAKITSAVGSLATLLLQAGKNVVQGLIDGIKSKLGSLSSVASSVAQTIRNFLPFSPAKEGPLSGSGNPYHSGQVIAGDLAGGVQSQLPTVRSAAQQLAGQFGIGGPSLAAAGGGAGFTIDTTGSRLDMLLIEVLKETIREKFGGDVDLAIGKKARR